MNRRDLQQIAKIRRKEAKILIDNKKYDGAYYLLGYIVECALKSCIARKTRKYDFPDKKKVDKSYTHELETLVGLAELKMEFEQEKIRNPTFEIYWNVVKDWDENSRYKRYIKREAQDMYKAVLARNNGVLRWIRQYW